MFERYGTVEREREREDVRSILGQTNEWKFLRLRVYTACIHRGASSTSRDNYRQRDKIYMYVCMYIGAHPEERRPSPYTAIHGRVLDIILELWASWLVTKPWKVSNYEQEAIYGARSILYWFNHISLNARPRWQFAANALTRAHVFQTSRLDKSARDGLRLCAKVRDY